MRDKTVKYRRYVCFLVSYVDDNTAQLSGCVYLRHGPLDDRKAGYVETLKEDLTYSLLRGARKPRRDGKHHWRFVLSAFYLKSVENDVFPVCFSGKYASSTDIHVRMHTRWLLLESNRGYRRLRMAMIQRYLGLLRVLRRVGRRQDSRSLLRWYSCGKGVRCGGLMKLAEHYSVPLRLVVCHLRWN